MAQDWTEDQKKAIYRSGHNILVSAAAGSGKTAVLIERIFNKIIKGVNVDEILVVTFTKAAAAEMKERLRTRLQKAAASEKLKKERDRLTFQLAILGDAQITTIDSFCLNLIKSFLGESGVEPGFRVAESGELSLLEDECFKDTYEDFYKKDAEGLFSLCEAYGSGKKYDISGPVNEIYKMAIGQVNIGEWLEGLKKTFDSDAALEWYISIVRKEIEGYIDEIDMTINRFSKEKELLCSLDTLESDKLAFLEILSCKEMEKFILKCCEMSFVRFSSPRKADESIKELSKIIKDDIRDGYKKDYAENTRIFKAVIGGNIKDKNILKKRIGLLVDFVIAYHDRISKEKKKRKIITFNDMEHIALGLLKKEGNESLEIAEEIREKYKEVMVDEYQDVSFLQNEILNLVSNGKNFYMVGDVKQSIYSFRDASPEIFIEKQENYAEIDNDTEVCTSIKGEKISLHKNFRSLKGVIDSVNNVFYPLMTEEFSGIDYNDKESLRQGLENDSFLKTDLILIEDKNEVDHEDSAVTLQARFIAERILSFKAEKRKVFDKNTGSYRDIEYRDIAIILRTTGKIKTLAEELNRAGIPAFAESVSNYLDTFEIRQVTEFLKIIDNPLQDIPFAGALRSYFGGFTDDELAKIRMIDKDLFFYDLVKNLSEDEKIGKESNLSPITLGKIKSFMSLYDTMEKLSVTSSIYDLLWYVVYDTGFYDYINNLPLGEKRVANVDLLLTRAAKFEGTGYSGIYQFINYINKLRKKEAAVGEISVINENDNVVRIMTIHKSKGLEFPVVFIANAQGSFPRGENRLSISVSKKLGIGPDAVDLELRTKETTIYKEAVKKENLINMISEEMRLLYVAMTRAREKLYIVGALKESDFLKYKRIADGIYEENDERKKYSFAKIIRMKNYLDMAVSSLSKDLQNCNLRFIDGGDIGAVDEKKVAYKEIFKKSDIKFIYRPYKYLKETKIPQKFSVTGIADLKNKLKEGDITVDFYQDKDDEEDLPVREGGNNFKSPPKAASIGNAFHIMMENLDFNHAKSLEEINSQADELLKKKILDNDLRELVNPGDILNFVKSKAGERACAAFNGEDGARLVREQEFMESVDVEGIEDSIIVQGVIDLYIEYEDGIIIYDYKTDRVSHLKDPEKELINRHKCQLEMYGEALSRLIGKKLKGKFIYSVNLGKEVEC